METQGRSALASAHGLTNRLKEDSRQQLESRKRAVADRIDEVASALGRASQQLEKQPTLAGYADQVAASVGNLAARLREGNIEHLIDDARQSARRHPELFILGGFALGIALARFVKASSSRRENPITDSDAAPEADDAAHFGEISSAAEDYRLSAQSPRIEASEQSDTSTSPDRG